MSDETTRACDTQDRAEERQARRELAAPHCSPLPCDALHTTIQHCFDVWSEGADVWRRESSHGSKVHAVEAQQAFLTKWPGAITRIVEKTTTERVVNEKLKHGE